MNYVPCNICGSYDSEQLYDNTLEQMAQTDPSSYRCTCARYGKHPPIVRCRRCGLVYANPRKGDETILAAYEQVVDSLYETERQGRLLTFRQNLQALLSFVPPDSNRRLLDIGCYTGVFLEVSQQAGWSAWGVEPSHWAAHVAASRGLRVHRGTLRGAAFPDDFFDVVTLWDVIEHLPDPKATMKEVARVLRPGGLLVIHTINIASLTARLLGPRWPWLMEMHLVYFSVRTLSRLLQETGFSVTQTNSQGRFLRLGYLLSRTKAYFPRLADGFQRVVFSANLKNIPVAVDLGDLFTCYAINQSNHQGPKAQRKTRLSIPAWKCSHV